MFEGLFPEVCCLLLYLPSLSVVLSVTCEDKKTPLSAEELKEFAQLQNDIELYKAKLRSEFGYSNKDIKAGLEVKMSGDVRRIFAGLFLVCPASVFTKLI